MKKQSKQAYKCLIFIYFALFMIGCGNDTVSKIKSGVLNIDRSVTVGDALEKYKYFMKTEWKLLEDEQKRQFVQFTGELNLDKLIGEKNQFGTILTSDDVSFLRKANFKNRCIVQFVILKGQPSDSNPFQVGASEFSYTSDLGNSPEQSGVYVNIHEIYSNTVLAVCTESIKKFIKQNSAQDFGRYGYLIGKHPSEVTKNQKLVDFFKGKLGNSYDTFASCLSGPGENIRLEGQYIVGEACAPHSCGSLEAFFAIDTKTNQFYFVVYDQPNFAKNASSLDNWPIEVRKMLAAKNWINLKE